jgi:hypothetical protein
MRYEAVETGKYSPTLAIPCNLYPEAEDGGCKFLLNADKYLPIHTASCHGRLDTLSATQTEP